MDTKPDVASAILAELKRSNDIKERALAASAPGAAQSDDSAIVTEIKGARERAAETTDLEKLNAEAEALAVRIRMYEADKARVNPPTRVGQMSTADATEHIRASLGVVKAQTVELFRGLHGDRSHNSDVYRARFGDRSPLEVLICGAMIPERGNAGMAAFVPGYENGRATDPLLAEIRDLHDGVLVWRIASQAKTNGGGVNMSDCPLWGRYQVALQKLQHSIIGKALDTSDTSNFVPTSFSAELIQRYDLQRNVTKALRAVQVPRFPYEIPGAGSVITIYAIAEQTAAPENATGVTESDPVDRKTSFTRKRLGARTAFSRDLEADSTIATATWIREELAKGIAYGEEQFIVDSDNATFHMDVDETGPVAGSTNIKRQILGIRAWCVDQSYTTSLATFGIEGLSEMVQEMGKYATNPADCCWIGPAKVRAKMLIAVNAGNYPVVIGMNSGQPATTAGVNIVNQFLGMDYVVMEGFRTNLNATGFYDGTTSNKTGVLLINKTRWAYAYDSLAPMIESISWPRTLQVEVVASVRRDMGPTEATTEHIAEYGIAVA